MTVDICLNPGCGALLPDDDKLCKECGGLGRPKDLLDGRKRERWTNSMWREWNAREAG